MNQAVRTVLNALGRLAVGGLVLAIRGYQATVSPLVGSCCRYAPTCSRYAVEALRRHGIWKGSALAAWRVLRCHPFACGGSDPVPPTRRPGRATSR
ncbi:MAG TPA: membrane protein insertion efficiency factor YidD [Phycisphaerae bacterium]|nr:membrane protein insertion efficiency factor YidD [Phycisphaerae bacterium]